VCHAAWARGRHFSVYRTVAPASLAGMTMNFSAIDPVRALSFDRMAVRHDRLQVSVNVWILLSAPVEESIIKASLDSSERF
jgi:hypothetical protein